MTDAIDVTLLATLARQTLEEMRQMRRELADVRTLTLHTSDYVRRLDRRMGELRDDLEMMLKSEIMGALTHFETRLEGTVDRLAERIDALETHQA